MLVHDGKRLLPSREPLDTTTAIGRLLFAWDLGDNWCAVWKCVFLVILHMLFSGTLLAAHTTVHLGGESRTITKGTSLTLCKNCVFVASFPCPVWTVRLACLGRESRVPELH